jgi:hypothetical protein
VRRFQIGARTGLALDPELVLAGVHAQFATGLNRNVIFRPNLEFAFGELTTAFAINLEALYRLPVSSRQARWGAYVGAGPGINFLKQSLTRRDRDVDFSDLDTDVSLNLFGGIQNRNGMFLEMKTSVYADPCPEPPAYRWLQLLNGQNLRREICRYHTRRAFPRVRPAYHHGATALDQVVTVGLEPKKCSGSGILPERQARATVCALISGAEQLRCARLLGRDVANLPAALQDLEHNRQHRNQDD